MKLKIQTWRPPETQRRSGRKREGENGGSCGSFQKRRARGVEISSHNHKVKRVRKTVCPRDLLLLGLIEEDNYEKLMAKETEK